MTYFMQVNVSDSKTRNYLIWILALIGSLLIGIGLLQFNSSPVQTQLASDFSIMTFDGQYMRLSDFRGDIVVLNFWASWCGPCRVEAPAFQIAWEYYRERGDVQFIGLAYNDKLANSMAFLDEFKMTFMNAPDFGHEITDLFGVTSIPTTIIINRDGHIVDYLYARQTLDSLIEHIEKQL